MGGKGRTSGVFILAAAIIFMFSGPALAQDDRASARSIFAMLPASIFESTPEGLSEADKQDLLNEGRCEFWEIAAETRDVLVLASLPLRERAIGMRLFRNIADGSVEVAVGTLGEPICSLELWRLDSSGRLVPVAGPDEPKIGEFFKKGNRIPKKLSPSILICLGSGGLVAKPVFWDKKGRITPKIDNEISFQWNGQRFEKQSLPVARALELRREQQSPY